MSPFSSLGMLAFTLLLKGARADDFLPKEVEAFKNFTKTFGKNYSGNEYQVRLKIFVNHTRFIAEQNSGNQSHLLGITVFADLTEEEFVDSSTGRKPNTDGGRLLQQYSNGGRRLPGPTPPPIQSNESLRSARPLPATLNWVKRGAVNPVKDQGQCGSCWSFSTIGALEGAWQILTGKLVKFSEQQLVDCSGTFGNQGCNGGLEVLSYLYMMRDGVCTYASYAYISGKTQQAMPCKASKCTVLPQLNVVGFVDLASGIYLGKPALGGLTTVPMFGSGNYDALMQAVNQQPVTVAIYAASWVFQLYYSGVITEQACGLNLTPWQLDHSILLVGYGVDSTTGMMYWYVKNQYGVNWGMKGYAMLERTGKDGPGTCGIQLEATYPLIQSLSLSKKATRRLEVDEQAVYV